MCTVAMSMPQFPCQRCTTTCGGSESVPDRTIGMRETQIGMIKRAVSAPPTLETGELDSDYYDTVSSGRSQDVKVVNWNIAAPNNNPFEYWATHDDEEYVRLMTAVQQFIDNPGVNDQRIECIFAQSMFEELKDELDAQGVSDLQQLDSFWTNDLKARKAITEFLKDPSLGEKRLISMPDRMTSSIQTESGALAFRPSPITGILDEMNDIPTWWCLWKKFIFKTPLCIKGKPMPNAFSLFEIIPRAKYPALTEEEECMSLSLQTLCLALFDAVFTHLLCCVAPATWQPLKRSLHHALFENKAVSCVSILQSQYSHSDVIFIQEASESFASKAGVSLDHFVLRPCGVDGRRSQMSLILARQSSFLQSTARDVTDMVMQRLPVKCVAKGDLCVFDIMSCHQGPYLLASFHGDSNGKSTLPVLAAVHGLVQERYRGHTLVFGLDANTSSRSMSSQLGVGEFDEALGNSGLASCWQGQELEGLWTTFNARTFLQPQLQKAVGPTDVLDRRHMQLKDWIVFYGAQLSVERVERDNTGRRRFAEVVMPSRSFPSDHAIVAATLRHVVTIPWSGDVT